MLLTPEEPNEIDLIEARIASLEKHIIGNLQSTENYSPVIDSLITTNALIGTALSGREPAAMFMRRLDELDKLLDPARDDETVDARAKLEEVLVLEPQLQQNLKSLKEVQDLLPVLDSEHIKYVPNLSDRLEKLTLFHLDKKQEADNVTTEVTGLIKQYNTIIMNVTKSFVQFEENLTQYEIASQPKKEPE
ncbi:Dynactin subunit 3 [Blattella germanica]|nr:Dynactin subunit 3 [Blattella germanica]PSN42123.1 Dynactin subunit 3 [Blattella germanica]